MNKLLGLFFMTIGILVMCYVLLAILFTKGVILVLGVVIPLVLGWVLFNTKTDPPRTIKQEIAYVRSWFRKAAAKVDEVKTTVKDTVSEDANA